ncbi:hypothetical protein ACJX0J_031383 [Zea mays]
MIIDLYFLYNVIMPYLLTQCLSRDLHVYGDLNSNCYLENFKNSKNYSGSLLVFKGCHMNMGLVGDTIYTISIMEAQEGFMFGSIEALCFLDIFNLNVDCYRNKMNRQYKMPAIQDYINMINEKTCYIAASDAYNMDVELYNIPDILICGHNI